MDGGWRSVEKTGGEGKGVLTTCLDLLATVLTLGHDD